MDRETGFIAIQKSAKTIRPARCEFKPIIKFLNYETDRCDCNMIQKHKNFNAWIAKALLYQTIFLNLSVNVLCVLIKATVRHEKVCKSLYLIIKIHNQADSHTQETRQTNRQRKKHKQATSSTTKSHTNKYTDIPVPPTVPQSFWVPSLWDTVDRHRYTPPSTQSTSNATSPTRQCRQPVCKAGAQSEPTTHPTAKVCYNHP